MNKILILCTLLLLACAAGALAQAPIPAAPPTPAQNSVDCAPGFGAWLATAAPAPAAFDPVLLSSPLPRPQIGTCNPALCARLHGACVCDQHGSCHCEPV
ncbi:MAG TPA: hypothetical protein VOA87_02965 [Thermoanaerobaculia bacterium]|nr:hypothetical protein [Thermoanaerobaculia bacterium]